MNAHCAELSSCITTFIQYSKKGQINLSLISKHDEMNTINIYQIFMREFSNIINFFSIESTVLYNDCYSTEFKRSELTHWT